MTQAIATPTMATTSTADIYPHATRPRRIYNPVQKDTATFLESALDNEGTCSIIELEIAPGGGNMLHYHITFAERFTVISGEFGVQIGTKTFTLKPGESATADTMVLHRWYNNTSETAIVRVELLPGSVGFERTLQISYGLARDGLVNKQGLPKNILQLAVLVEMSDTIVPGFFAKILPLMRIAAKFARRKGIERELIERYCL